MLFNVLFLLLPLLIHSRYHRFQYSPRNTQCHCVLPQLCDDDDVVMNGHGLLDPRAGDLACSNPKEICCSQPQQPPKELEVPPNASCGYTKIHHQTRVTSGTLTSFGELPWSLIIQEDGLYKCGGSLIHPRVALTAAHCVTPYKDEPEKLIVRAGEWDVDRKDEELPTQDNFVEEILVFYDYNSLSLKNDIALLILSEEFELRDNVALICLSTPKARVLENECVVGGWGKDAHKKGKYSSVLKMVNVPLMQREYCLEKLRGTRLGKAYRLHRSFVCAGGKKNRDACKGDGGSPLICPLVEDRVRFVQVGIVSWGIGCGGEGIPGVYANVPLFLEWIEGEMSQRDLDTGVFKA